MREDCSNPDLRGSPLPCPQEVVLRLGKLCPRKVERVRSLLISLDGLTGSPTIWAVWHFIQCTWLGSLSQQATGAVLWIHYGSSPLRKAWWPLGPGGSPCWCPGSSQESVSTQKWSDLPRMNTAISPPSLPASA